MSQESYATQMRDLGNEELYEIVQFGQEDEFVPEAVLAAKKEFDRRHLSSEQHAELAQSIQEKRQQKKKLAGKRLSWPARIAFFVFPLGFLPIVILVIVAMFLESKGYSRKSSEAYKWMGVGVVFWIGLGVVFFVLSRVFR